MAGVNLVGYGLTMPREVEPQGYRNLRKPRVTRKDKDEKQGTRAAQMAFLATQQDPGNAVAWLTLGAAYESMGKKQQAMDSYRSCARKAASHLRVADCKQRAGIKD